MSGDSLVILAAECRVPGANDLKAFHDLLMNGRTGYSELPLERGDRSLYFERERGRPGKSYTTLGGVVPSPSPATLSELQASQKSLFDPAHIHFADVAKRAWQSAGLSVADPRMGRTGIYVGHSGGTCFGGDLSLSVQIEETLTFLNEVAEFRELPRSVQQAVRQNVVHSIRQTRPHRDVHVAPRFEAYQAASLAAAELKLIGPRIVLDAACASSLTALSLAMLAIQAGRIDSAIVGGATYNSVDNLILFSHSQACTERDSRPFDDGASGLVSSEGYVAIIIMKQAEARRHGLVPLAEVRGVGIASDGRGRSLWAPRKEGQVLALRRAYDGSSTLSARHLELLDIDYQEAHATSTQLGDATELETLHSLMCESPAWARDVGRRLPIGSAKSNIGHTLEAAGLIGVSKVLLAMQAKMIPPSLRYEAPNRGFEWHQSRVDVVNRNKPWISPVAGRTPTAAVSAFGIGGLNAHVVIQQTEQSAHPGKSSDFSESTSAQPAQGMIRESDDPVVIVGRGVVLPGAMNIKAFESLLNSSLTAITEAPESRWRSHTGVKNNTQPTFAATPHCRAGYVRDFVFDGAKYRIPPKQVQQANPLQMMFLDAVRQAIEECHRECHKVAERGAGHTQSFQKLTDFDLAWPVDRQRVGVVIGTIFGGEFGDQLQAGMRLPEIERELLRELNSMNVGAIAAKKIAESFRHTLLSNRPALLDETGSFTASTLASRIAKTFDLMGGACALDSDDASGMNALVSAVDQLNAGSVDLVVCGAGTRALNLSLFELLDHQKRLLRSGNPAEIPENLSQIIPGEGASVALLCRRSTAVRAGMKILGTIAPSKYGRESQNVSHDAVDLQIARKTGYLPGAHSLVRVVAETLELNVHPMGSGAAGGTEIMSRAQDGQVAGVRIIRGDMRSVPPSAVMADSRSDSLAAISSSGAKTGNGNESGLFSQPASSARLQSSAMRPSTSFLRLGAADADGMLALIESLVRNGGAIQSLCGGVQRLERSSPEQFSSSDRLRVILPVGHPQGRAIEDRLAAVAKAVRSGRVNAVLDRDLAVIWKSEEPAASNRVAWLFPGQGSHYPGQPSVLTENASAKDQLELVDAAYEAVGSGRLSSVLNDRSISIGEDLWWSQSWGLGLSCCLVSALRDAGLQPDVCLGHSLGEFSAAFAAKVFTVSELAQLARARAQAVMTQVRVAGGLLSVRASAAEVDAIVREDRLSVEISHLNSPKQTVVAGSREAIAVAQRSLEARHIASLPISVPAPFHTQLMRDAETVFSALSGAVRLRVPTTAFLSATSARYLSEPQDIRQSLVRQLTKPVMYLAAVERLLSDDVRLFIEVGPNDVLTRLTREITGPRAICVSADVPDQTFAQRLALIQAAMECVTGVPIQSKDTSWTTTNADGREGTRDSLQTLSQPARSGDVRVFDVTRRVRKSLPSLLDQNESTARSEVVQSVFAGSTADSGREQNDAELSSKMATSAAVAPGISRDQVRHYLKDLIVELTGYSPDIIEADSDLEADLGIDSIKRAQILGELASWLGITVRPNTVRFDRVRTLNDAVALALELAAASESSRESTESSVNSHRVVSSDASTVKTYSGQDRVSQAQPKDVAESSPLASRPAPSSTSVPTLPSASELDQLLVAYVCDQTGYSPDVVDVEADLEAELGLDSIKLAQLIGEIRSQFSLQHLSRELVAQARFRTLRDIREFLLRHGATDRPAATKTETAEPAALASLDSRESRRNVSQSSESRAVRGHASVLDMARTELDWTRGVSRLVTGHSGSSTSLTDFGREHRLSIRETVRQMLPGAPDDGNGPPRLAIADSDFIALDAIAEGAGVDGRSLRRMVVSSDEVGRITQRYLLRVIDAPVRNGTPEVPEFHGSALILGDNVLAQILCAELASLGVPAEIQGLTTSDDVEAKLADLWARHETPHLFLTMAFDESAATDFSCKDWDQRRSAALELPFRVCQLWMQRMIAADLMDEASVVAVTRLGGDYGFSGKQVQSFEAIGGLIKAMLIESWMRGFRTTPMKVVDAAPNLSLPQIVKGILRELAVPSYDMEIALGNANNLTTTALNADAAMVSPVRRTVQAISAPLASLAHSAKTARPQVTPGGTWVVSGGGRGISAAISQELALKHRLKLRLLGTAPRPQLSAQILRDAENDMAALRRKVMQEAAAAGQSPIESWRHMEKALEIHRTLNDCARKGIDAQYYCCDVANVDEVKGVLEQIRRRDGTIHGIIHGAGFGQDSRFDRKRPDKVRQCLKAKIDGTLALMEATMTDRLEWFAAFGSISGRFGANGHTDYSLANDMMAKIVDRYRMIRPETRSVTFHWHAWGDIGMATKPEARLALEMIDMRFMPAAEGMSHFLDELEFGGEESEVLITDEEYFRKFFPADRLASTENRPASFPLVSAKPVDKSRDRCVTQVTLNPVSDAFLAQHRVNGRPVLPFVVALEMMAETASLLAGAEVKRCLSATARQALRFSTDDAQAVVLEATWQKPGHVLVRLLADVRRRDGRLVEEGREYFCSVFTTISKSRSEETRSHHARGQDESSTVQQWSKVRYAEPDAAVWHGPVFQELRKYHVDAHTVIGRIAASAAVQLFGGERSSGFLVPCSTFDACLYLIGLANVQLSGRLSLPVEFHSLQMGRLPDPGEPCDVRAWRHESDDHGATWSFALTGQNGDLILSVDSYRTGWLSNSGAS